MLVRDIMQQNVVTLDVTDRLDLASSLMRLDRIRHLPVIANGRVAGIVSQRDLFRADVSSALEYSSAARQRWLAEIPVHSVMTSDVVTVPPATPVHDAVDLMTSRRIGCLPVVEEGRLVGLLAESDCMRYLAHLLEITDLRRSLPEVPSTA
jgi:CBS domain-containing protein